MTEGKRFCGGCRCDNDNFAFVLLLFVLFCPGLEILKFFVCKSRLRYFWGSPICPTAPDMRMQSFPYTNGETDRHGLHYKVVEKKSGRQFFDIISSDANNL